MSERLELAGIIERGDEDALVRIADQIEQVAMELFTSNLIAYRASGQALVGEVESLNYSIRERLGL